MYFIIGVVLVCFINVFFVGKLRSLFCDIIFVDYIEIRYGYSIFLRVY